MKTAVGELFIDAIQHILIDEASLHAKVRELAATISRDLFGKEVLMVCVLKGSFCFFADLVRAMNVPVSVDFVACSSYGDSDISGGKLQITKDLTQDPRGKALVIVEDIVDSGLTLRELKRFLSTKGPETLHTVSLLDKPSRRKVAIEADYVGFAIPDEFVVGYGLDYAERFRQLPYVAVLKAEVYSVTVQGSPRTVTAPS